jgi:hypothetical protein
MRRTVPVKASITAPRLTRVTENCLRTISTTATIGRKRYCRRVAVAALEKSMA